ncbi:EFR1 family ferrodoxin [Paenibacillus tepidiphilus]|uniref:EFR1 family ferrodoxin n=1 Tax=Paenibacillus tepidiphilus TaxID=2608683 RepID=UPI00123B7CCC|nr:EFR1 family ferrodoxin [Paenibacillus tepidiphilus]
MRKSDHAIIFYFSGTGNTELIARGYAEALRRRNLQTELCRIEDLLGGRQCVDFTSYGLIGIGHPVYGFGAPRLVETFAAGLPAGERTPVFVFKTASSPHAVNHRASKPLIRQLEGKGYEVYHDSLLAMACNFYVKYDERLNKQLYQSALRKLDLLADEIAAGTSRELRVHPLLEKALRLLNDWEERKAGKYFAGGLQVGEACTYCMKCVRNCPAGNISCEAGHFTFGPDCLLCMRCVYSCPRQAIKATRLRGSVVEPFTGGARLVKLLEEPGNDGRFVTAKSRGYYKHFIRYLLEDERQCGVRKE